MSTGRLGLIDGTLRRYLLPYFGARPINEITQTDFGEYDDWRLNYWTSGYGAERRTANAAKKTRQTYVTNEAGERVSKTTERRLRKWYWGNADDVWFMELRYAGKALKLGVNKTSIEVGEKDKLATVIGLLKDAVKAGELDKALMTARKERAALMRKT